MRLEYVMCKQRYVILKLDTKSRRGLKMFKQVMHKHKHDIPTSNMQNRRSLILFDGMLKILGTNIKLNMEKQQPKLIQLQV